MAGCPKTIARAFLIFVQGLSFPVAPLARTRPPSSELAPYGKREPRFTRLHAGHTDQWNADGHTEIEMLADVAVEAEARAPHFGGGFARAGLDEVALAVI